jgi:hypothetical protein
MSELKLKRLNIGKSSYIHYDTIVIDEYSSNLVFASLVDLDKDLKEIQKEINRKNNVYIESLRRYTNTDGKYDIEKRKQSNSDFGHLIINRRDFVEDLAEDNEMITCYIYVRNINDLDAKLYDKLYDNTSIPLLEEWLPYLKDYMFRNLYL